MIEILCKGKRKDNGKWVEGYYTFHPNGFNEKGKPEGVIRDTQKFIGKLYLVDPETVCQYKLTDKNSRKIFEGDICKYYNSEDKDGIAIIRADYAQWISGTIRQKHTMTPLFYLKCSNEWEYIGNILDNPELLEVEEECFIPEKDNPYPLCVGQGLAKCDDCQLRSDWEPENLYDVK